MTTTYLQLTPRDPLIARDGRPFGFGQGNRMRGLPWPLPSVVAGSLRTALVKSGSTLDFSGDIPRRLLQIAIAGVFPVHEEEMYLPAPNDAVGEPSDSGKEIRVLHQALPEVEYEDGCDFPDLGLKPVMLPAGIADFKPADIPRWWPLTKYVDWLVGKPVTFDSSFLNSPRQEIREHVRLDADRGAAVEGHLFATAGLNVTHMPRFGVESFKAFRERFAEVSLSARVTTLDPENAWNLEDLNLWHPLGGERRLVHWKSGNPVKGWACPDNVKSAMKATSRIRMVLATPAIFSEGWKPGWLKNGLEGELEGVRLKLVGVTNGRWKAVSGWSLAKINDKGELDPNGKPGPKATCRTVPAGSVYFFERIEGDPTALANHWLKSVSDDEQTQRDGFGLAVWGTW